MPLLPFISHLSDLRSKMSFENMVMREEALFTVHLKRFRV
jgi:hypothetical protein